jgi:hypothetical protein
MAMGRYDSDDPKDAAWRVEQAHADAEIEGIKRHPALAAFVEQMDAEGVDPEEQIKRIIAFDLRAAGNEAA